MGRRFGVRKVVLFDMVTLDGFFAGPNKEKLNLKLTNAKTFRNGNVLLCYQPDGK
jgi:hypothetical protein